MSSFYSDEEIKELGFKAVGNNVKLSKKASIYGAENIEIGSNVRIDDFSILSGNIVLNNNVHIAAYCSLFAGTAGIILEDFSGISSRTAIYAVSDDYSGEWLTNPTIPDEFRKIEEAKIIVGKHALVGSGCTLLPGSILNEGSVVGAMSLVNNELDEWSMYVGIPCKKIKPRNKELLKKEKEYTMQLE